jgi:2-hydroxymethylglutarate dehydrogenase
MKIGFVGIGMMGQHMVRHLLNGNHHVSIHDIDQSMCKEAIRLGAKYVENPGELANMCEIIFTSLPTPDAVESVMLSKQGVVNSADHKLTYFDLSTTDTDTLFRISNKAQEKGITVLDAPVSGGTSGAERGDLCIMVGGNRSHFEKYKPVLQLIGRELLYCGPLGSGAVCKIANNLIGMSLCVLLSEAFTMGIKAGVTADILYQAISSSTGDTRQMHSFPNSLFVANFEPGFKLNLGAKDVGLATNLGQKFNVPMPIANLVHQKFIEGQNSGLGNQAAISIAQLLENQCDIKIRTDTSFTS